jgi:hypothetical protein
VSASWFIGPPGYAYDPTCRDGQSAAIAPHSPGHAAADQPFCGRRWRQGQTAARNILGRRERFDAVPFFWSQHYDMAISYVGHAARWDATKIEGSLADHDGKVTFLQAGRRRAVATIFRDRDSLMAEAEMERRVTPG